MSPSKGYTVSYRRDRRDRAAIAGIAVGALLLGLVLGMLFAAGMLMS
jgi:uncharacterized protein YcfJ